MVRTAILGIPVLQLIDPINIWIGAPLAAVVYFIDKIAAIPASAKQELSDQMSSIKRLLSSVRADQQVWDTRTNEPAPLSQETYRLTVYFALLERRRPILSKLVRLLLICVIRLERLRAFQGKWAGPMSLLVVFSVQALGWFLLGYFAFIAFYNYVVALLQVPLIVVLCVAYILLVYPMLPQTIGGGRPTAVQLVIEIEKIPLGTLSTLAVTKTLPQSIVEKALIAPATLYYTSEKDYYVKFGTGRITCISRDAVQGVIYPAPPQWLQSLRDGF